MANNVLRLYATHSGAQPKRRLLSVSEATRGGLDKPALF